MLLPEILKDKQKYVPEFYESPSCHSVRTLWINTHCWSVACMQFRQHCKVSYYMVTKWSVTILMKLSLIYLHFILVIKLLPLNAIRYPMFSGPCILKNFSNYSQSHSVHHKMSIQYITEVINNITYELDAAVTVGRCALFDCSAPCWWSAADNSSCFFITLSRFLCISCNEIRRRIFIWFHMHVWFQSHWIMIILLP